MEWKVSITGEKKLDKALRNLEPKFRRKVANKAMRKGMKIIQRTAKSYAPVGKPQKDHTPGLLKKNIKVRAGKRSRRTFGIDVRIGDKDWQGKAWYGSAVVFGTKKQKENDFMKRAYKDKESQVRKQVINDMWQGIEDIAKEGAR
ncbi:hypothetical protein C5Y96_09845 [Blastopirellula marina]|uniref:HK97 gp10 family phage protein n=1 Tax=Blastopirellula marina TaxID=124 RepID=A0A2S8FLT6_9BACT|nr:MULTISPECIES: HK97-gp10 family putative phage morphogenesis protein [Pirellulaceae]PQO33152.1 hypothetical protein C5Y96_09845 [Blastopirellula marina]RCS52241.1 hypothetical protein DTL36_09855 [Bremerella cremea]